MRCTPEAIWGFSPPALVWLLPSTLKELITNSVLPLGDFTGADGVPGCEGVDGVEGVGVGAGAGGKMLLKRFWNWLSTFLTSFRNDQSCGLNTPTGLWVTTTGAGAGAGAGVAAARAAVTWLSWDISDWISVRRACSWASGEATEVERESGLVDQTLVALAVSAKPADIPNEITVDVSELTVGGAIRVGDLQLPSGVTTELDPEEPVVTGQATRATIAAAEGEGEEGEEGEGGEAEASGDEGGSAEDAGGDEG